MRRLLAPSLLLLAGACSSDFLLDAAPASNAGTIIYFVQRDGAVLSARVVSSARQGQVTQLNAPANADIVVTAASYARLPEALGLEEGELQEDVEGSSLPEPDALYQTSARSGVWERLSVAPPIVATFRSATKTSARCANPTVRDIPTTEFNFGSNIGGFSPAADLAVIYFGERSAVSIRSDLSIVISPLGTDSPWSITASGTIALGLQSSGCVSKLSVDAEGLVSSRQWFCGQGWQAAYPGELGNFALVAANVTAAFDRQGREVSRVAERSPSYGLVLLGEEYFGRGGLESVVYRLSPRGQAREQVNGHGEFITGLTVIRGRVYAAGSAGSVFERRTAGSWFDLGKSGIGDVDKIIATPRGFLAVGGVGEVTEFIDGYGWCPTKQLASDDSSVVLPLGSGYLFYSSGLVRSSPSLTWADFGF